VFTGVSQLVKLWLVEK